MNRPSHLKRLPLLAGTTLLLAPLHAPLATVAINATEIVHQISTQGAFDWAPFELEGACHLAVANCSNDGTNVINSVIYRWDGGALVPIQEIGGVCAIDWESFSIDGPPHLALASHHSSANLSRIYRWDGAQFVELQTISTVRPRDLEAFEVDGTPFLITANSTNGSTSDIPSTLYRWDGVAFVEHQSIDTHGAYHWEHFVIDGTHYLAVANTTNSQNQPAESFIYRWDGNRFIEHQSLPAAWTYDIAPFTIDGHPYIAIANGYSGSSRTAESWLYRWDGGRFVHHQSITTTGILEWEPFSREGAYYLGAANYRSDSSFHTDSVIYQWDGNQFNQTLTLPSIGGKDLAFFTADGVAYLAGANFYDGATHNLTSPIHRLLETPRATIVTPSLSGSAPFTVTLDGSTSADPDGGELTHYQWLTSDGRNASGSSALFTFDLPGSYSIQLTVTDDEGEATQSSINIQVNTIDANNCEGRASYSAATGELNLPLMNIATVPLLGATGRPAGDATVPTSARLRIIPGTMLFEIVSVTSATPETNPTVAPCHAGYSIDGVLEVPVVDVPVVTAIGGLTVTTGMESYRGPLELLPMSDLFQLTNIEQLP